jgi:hypothetical protein
MSPVAAREPHSRWIRSWWWCRTIAGALVLAGAVWACASLGFFHAFTRFNDWDDEGYFLLALRRFREHGGLYEQIREVFYGPFYFEAIGWGSRLLHVPLDHASARWFMIGAWVAAVAASALAAWRLSGSMLAGAIAGTLGFQFLLLFTNEPLHATSLLLILLALLLTLRFRAASEREPGLWTMAACGAVCAAIALVKLNVGLFVVCAFLGAHPPAGAGRAAGIARRGLALGLVLLPFALMRVLLGDALVLDFALLVSTALIPFAWFSARTPEWTVQPKALIAFAAGAAALTVVSIGACLASGTTFAGLWRSLVLDALAFPTRVHHSPELPGLGQILLGLLALPVFWAVHRRPLARALLQLGVGLWLLYGSLKLQMPLESLQFVWIPALAGERSARRALLGLLAVLLTLQAFPVAGSQLGICSFLVPLVALTGVWEACRSLAQPESFARIARVARVVVPPAAAAGAYLLLMAHSPFLKTWSAAEFQWRALPALDLPGCGPLHLPELEGAQQTWLAANLKQNADTFVGLAGVPSAHIWSGVPAPVPFYSHHWVLYYDAEREAALAQALFAAQRPCIVRNIYLLNFWTESLTFRDGPFSRALETDFKLAGRVGLYELWLPRAATPDLVLSVFPAAPGKELMERYGARRAFRLRFPAGVDYQVAHIALHNVRSGVDLLDTASPKPESRMTALTLQGAQLLPYPPVEPLDPRRTSEVLLLLPPFKSPAVAKQLLFRAYDASGRVVARLLPEILP